MSKNADQFFFNQVLEQGFYDSNADMGKLVYNFGSTVAICMTGRDGLGFESGLEKWVEVEKRFFFIPCKNFAIFDELFKVKRAKRAAEL